VTFTAPALGAVHRLSTGVPRLINLLCDRALLAGYVQGARTITEQMVRQSAHEIAGQPPRGRRPWAYVGLGAVAALTALAAFLWLPGALPTPAAAKPSAVEAKLTLAVPAASVATPPPPIATTPPGPGPLEGIVLSLPREASFQRSVASVQSQWNGGPIESTSFRTQLEQIRRLDLPVVLEMFHPARKDTCFVALLRLQNEEASVMAGATPLSVPVPELDRYWTRQAFFLWRDYDSVGRAAHPERAMAWARSGLSRLGYMHADADLTAAVTRFQQDADLMPDGVVGSRTLMTLYSRGPYPRPRLSAGGGS
jgi:general secretion pathway protein A